MVSLFEEDNHVIEDKRKCKSQMADTHQNQRRHMPPVSLLLWCEMVAECCIIWPLALDLSGKHQANQKSVFKKKSISGCL